MNFFKDLNFFSDKTCRVVIRNKNIVLESKSGKNLYKFLLSKNIIPASLCGGNGQCGKCKIRFFGKNIPKATKQEELILAKVNIDMGYRLACCHKIKQDIEIDTSEVSFTSFINIQEKEKSYFPNIPEKPLIKNADEEKKEESGRENREGSAETEKQEKEAQGAEKPEETRKEKKGCGLDAVFIIQQRKQVRYFCYSSSKGSISSQGIEKTDKLLKQIIDEDLIPDFLHNVLNINETERVLILIEKTKDYKTEEIFSLIKYFRNDVGMLLSEVIMPAKDNHDIVRFFRLIGQERNKSLMISLDMLDRIYFLTDNIICDLRYGSLLNPNMTGIIPEGRNPIIEVTDNLVCIADKEKETPDGITISAFLRLVSLMVKHSIIDGNFKLKTRTELTEEKAPLAHTVRIVDKNDEAGFYLHRDRFSEFILYQKELDALNQIRKYILSVIRYVQERIGAIESISVYTASFYEDIAGLMCELEFIPREFAGKTFYKAGDASINVQKLFREKDIAAFASKYLNNSALINLQEESKFSEIAEKVGFCG